jgi:hypothetical protein
VAASMGTVTDVVAVISMTMTIPVTGARTVAAAWVRFAGSHAGNVIARSPDRAVTAYVNRREPCVTRSSHPNKLA